MTYLCTKHYVINTDIHVYLFDKHVFVDFNKKSYQFYIVTFIYNQVIGKKTYTKVLMTRKSRDQSFHSPLLIQTEKRESYRIMAHR